MTLLTNLNAKECEIQIEAEEKEPDYESPNGSKWIVAVSDDGTVSILRIPNIHYSFTDEGNDPETFGLPDEVEDAAGVYEWTCNLVQHRDWETGYVDDWNFEVTNIKLLYGVDNGEVNESGNQATQSDNGLDPL